MKNYYEERKESVIEDIIENLVKTDIITLYDIKNILEKEKPLFIRDYIDKFWNDHSEGFKDDLEHEIRKFWNKINPNNSGMGHYNLEASGEVEHFTDLYVKGQDLDVWVMEQGTDFNPSDIAQSLFHIYIGKVVFYK